MNTVKLKEEQKYRDISRKIPGIDLNEEKQLELLDKFKEFYKDLPFEAHKKGSLRFFFENPRFSYTDAIILYSMIRYARPKKIIEVGSGYSSCVTLDTNELFFNNTISCTFIEPYPQRLLSLIKTSDMSKINLLPQKLQDIELNLFSELSNGDILFIDSTHISKIDSDVNYLFFKILPYLKNGVIIHFHDIFYPFEYPKSWIYIGRAWNEIYLLRSFLQYNNSFKIQFFNSFITYFYTEEFIKDLPLCMNNTGGSLWIKKIK